MAKYNFTRKRDSIGAKVTIDNKRNEHTLLITINGWQWNGNILTVPLAKLIIKVLELYIKDQEVHNAR